MSKWQHTLDIEAAWTIAAKDGNFRVLAKEIADKLKKIDFGEDFNDERNDISYVFDELSNDDNATVGEFDTLMQELYEFADTPLDHAWNGARLLWVKTF